MLYLNIQACTKGRRYNSTLIWKIIQKKNPLKHFQLHTTISTATQNIYRSMAYSKDFHAHKLAHPLTVFVRFNFKIKLN